MRFQVFQKRIKKNKNRSEIKIVIFVQKGKSSEYLYKIKYRKLPNFKKLRENSVPNKVWNLFQFNVSQAV